VHCHQNAILVLLIGHDTFSFFFGRWVTFRRYGTGVFLISVTSIAYLKEFVNSLGQLFE
jgi:hypothetical protein